jgi:hypothetical protein
MAFFEAVLKNEKTGRQEDYLLKADNEGDVADYLISEGNSYCGEGNFTYDFTETTKKNRKFKAL